MSNHLHIICLDAPSPPDYGGAIDMYYKIIALAESGRKIILHYFEYKESRGAEGLHAYCSEVNVYKRKGLSAKSFSTPYIISTRINTKLIERLNQDEYPVLLEGLHCSGIVPYIQNKERIVIRMHNEESGYYRSLSKTEKSISGKIYFRLESLLIKKYYRKIAKYDLKYACLSQTDMEVLGNFGLKQLHFIPCFIPWQWMNINEGKGYYCLYHGNMRVSENESAAEWLIKIFSQLDLVLVIAGNGISEKLRSLAGKYLNVKLINHPSMNELDVLIRDAHINVLPSMNTTGVKLKLLHAVLEGRFCLTNTSGVKGSGIENLVHIADGIEEYRKLVMALYEKPFTEEDKKNRKDVLAVYDNLKNASKINELW